MDKFMNSESSSEDGLSTRNVHHPAFFQLYTPGHNSMKLCIPPPFIKNFGGNIPEKISLKNSSGRVWRAKLTYFDNELHITHGWKRYVKDHKLQPGEFVVFRYQHDSTFLVLVYGPDNLLKKEPVENRTSANSRGEDERFTDVRRTEVGSLRFYKTFRNKFNSCGNLPKNVIEACTITLPQSVRLTNDKGRAIRTHLHQETDRVVLGYAGLSRFWRKNGVEEGDTLEFEVMCGHGNKIKHIIMRKKTRSDVLRRGY